MGSDRLWVLHTRPRQEKSLARQLHGNRIPFYLPCISRRLRYRDRVMTSHVPLFPGYVFLRGDNDARVAALETSRVIQAIHVIDQDRLWQDLRQINQLIATGEPITPEERLVPGSIVEIRNGPLTGLRGKILRSASGNRFVVEVDFIHKGASLIIDDFALASCEVTDTADAGQQYAFTA
jgi:transcriptional antiterminator RfaH